MWLKLQFLQKLSPETLESHVLAIVQCLSDEPHLAAIDCCADDISCIRLEIAEADRQAWEIELVMGGGQVWCDLGRRGCDLERRGATGLPRDGFHDASRQEAADVVNDAEDASGSFQITPPVAIAFPIDPRHAAHEGNQVVRLFYPSQQAQGFTGTGH